MGRELTVVDLSDNDAWFVVGTTDVLEARRTVDAYIRDALRGDHDEVAEWLELLRHSEGTARSDWWWQPIDPEEPSGETYLRTLEGMTPVTATAVFEGVLFG